MVNGNQAHMPWMISKINEALYGIHSAHKAASLETITHLYRVPDSEHIDIIVGFVARASGRRAAIQLLQSRDGRQLYQSTTRFSQRSPQRRANSGSQMKAISDPPGWTLSAKPRLVWSVLNRC